MKTGSFQFTTIPTNCKPDFSLDSVKAVQTLDIALPPSSSGRLSTTVVCTVSSDGKIYLYDMATLPESPSNIEAQKLVEISPLVEYDSKSTRLTCVTLGDGERGTIGVTANGKRKRTDKDAATDDENDSEASDVEDGWGDQEEDEEEEEEEVEEEAEEDSD
jgi:protein MAK11